MAVVRTPDAFEARLALTCTSAPRRPAPSGSARRRPASRLRSSSATRGSSPRAARRPARGRGPGAREERERLYRLRESAAGGVIVRELAEDSDKLENAILARAGGVSGRVAAASLGAGPASGARRLRGPRRAGRPRGRRLRALQLPPLRADAEGRGARRRAVRRPDPVGAQRRAKDHRPPCPLGGAAGAARLQEGSWEPLRGLARPRAQFGTRRRARLAPGLLPAPHVPVRRALRQGPLCPSAWGRSRASDSTWARTRASSSTWTTGRRRARGPA